MMKTTTRVSGTHRSGVAAIVERERLSDGSFFYNVYLSDPHNDRRSVLLQAITEEHADRLAQTINECCSWAIKQK